MPFSRRQILGKSLSLLAAGGLSLGRRAEAQAVLSDGPTFFRIGTGSTAGTYYPVGSLLAAAISNPPGSHPCEQGGSCGVPGLIAIAQSTEGSVDNVRQMQRGTLDSGLCQADIAFWAASGEGVFAETGPIEDLRVIASLFPELLHVVVRRGAGINGFADLKGKRVSLDREGSGTQVDALLVLKALGIKTSSFEVLSLNAAQAVEALRKKELDAFFFVAGAPLPAVEALARQELIDLLPVVGPEIEKLVEGYPFFTEDFIPSGTYPHIGVKSTLSVAALWLVTAETPDDLVYEITRSLWSDATRRLLDSGHPRAREIRLEQALNGIGNPPLHEGALRYYREAGLPALTPHAPTAQ